jgi:hypothetical protein
MPRRQGEILLRISGHDPKSLRLREMGVEARPSEEGNRRLDELWHAACLKCSCLAGRVRLFAGRQIGTTCVIAC